MGREIFLWARRLAITAMLFGALYAWKVLGISGAGNLLKFYVWTLATLSLALVFAPAKYNSDLESKARATAGNLSAVAFCLALVWFGENGMAMAWVISRLIASFYRSQCLALRPGPADAHGKGG